MANHVYFNVNVKTNDPKVEKAFEEVMVMEEITRPFYASEDTYTVKELIDIDRLAFMPKGKYDSDDYLENSWDYYVNNVGAKWCSDRVLPQVHAVKNKAPWAAVKHGLRQDQEGSV